MNREIKFRGKRKDKINNEWYYGSLIIEPNETYWIDYYIENKRRTVEVNPKSVGQYTGLKDKNGVEIYEGDIISIHSPCIDKTLPWKPATTKFIGWHKDGFWNLFKKDQATYTGFRGILNSNLQYYTVVGNLHEHAELLK